ncbi:PREDICTED: uncharacterized protein LOC109184303 [Ipomoea nil]|uniref:uncharacterized protein LOC109184303 n=1 Tax=Ipomoea nil TaxID=35883 RepID=UPI000900B6DC|nr:PREDICTED: uncharacterized protein LOC109184303 [Ipomoea nil]
MISDEEETMEEIQLNNEAGEHHQDPPNASILAVLIDPVDPMCDILSWNCQGAASSGFRRALLFLVKKVKADIVGLMEPRISGGSADKACKSFGFDNWMRVEVVGFSGGMRQWIFKEGLIDLGLFGARFTWTRGREKNTFTGARLDRALCNLSWISRHPGTNVSHLARFCSDHSPILIDTTSNAKNGRAFPFQFQAAWLSHKDFSKVVSTTWDTKKNMLDNISNMQTRFVDWIKTDFGNIERRKNRLMARLDGIQNCLSNQPFNGLIRLERKLRLDLEETLHQEEIKWYQKSKEDWICSGDLNMKFYHAATMVRRAKNRIHGLKNDNDERLQNKDQVEALV